MIHNIQQDFVPISYENDYMHYGKKHDEAALKRRSSTTLLIAEGNSINGTLKIIRICSITCMRQRLPIVSSNVSLACCNHTVYECTTFKTTIMLLCYT